MASCTSEPTSPPEHNPSVPNSNGPSLEDSREVLIIELRKQNEDLRKQIADVKTFAKAQTDALNKQTEKPEKSEKASEDLKEEIKILTATIIQFMNYQKDAMEVKIPAAIETQTQTPAKPAQQSDQTEDSDDGFTLVGKRKRGPVTPPQEGQLPKAGNKGKQAPKSQAKPATKSTQSIAKANVQPSITKFATRPVQNKPTTKTAPQPVPKQDTTRPTQPAQVSSQATKQVLISTAKTVPTVSATVSQSESYPYHSFCHPEERAFRVIIKNIPESLCIDEVRELLLDQGFHLKFVQRWKLKSGIELPIVQVVVPREERQIIYMTKLGVITVKVEVQRGNGQPVQCFNCQLFGHSSSYCRAPPRCVKCAGHHDTRSCTKIPEAPPTCSNCGEIHTANFSGCSCRPAPRKPKIPTETRPPQGSAWSNQGGRKLAQKLASATQSAPTQTPAPTNTPDLNSTMQAFTDPQAFLQVIALAHQLARLFPSVAA
ncbi:hypothetical protein GWI33_022489 [Rhynchophorus ferrugineus]|uniref:Nucleic-acid-binding protein from transposon X-element n=1 Tax=Rhynchophorus ferrugineus TaxID=354439 RepID=A0A834MJ07_RHYFE|nr:hypothetical protein GWI33_022489 [Rhynchophorus ferrugineus]